jgi:Tol biopolymer transport system component
MIAIYLFALLVARGEHMMKTSSAPGLWRLPTIIAGLLVAAIACGLPGTSAPVEVMDATVEAPAAEEEAQPAAEEAPETVEDAAPSEVGPPPPQTGPSEGPPIGDLSAEGPWLVFATGEGLAANGLWAVNADGSGVTQLEQVSIVAHQLAQGVSPVGRMVAFVGSTGDLFRTPTLHMDRLPDTTGRLSLPLYGPQSQPAEGVGPGDPAFEAMRAIVEQPSLAWSPDGRQLAFMGAIDGPTSDLYVYSMDDDSITRLTDGPSQGFRPSWSPDGRWIAHAGVSTFGTGAGYGMEGVWAAPADGTAVKTLYNPNEEFNSGDEEFIGWIGDSALLVNSWDVLCGRRDIRAYDIESGRSTYHWVGYFTDAAYSPGERALLVTVDESTFECPQEGANFPGAGAYLIDLTQLGAKQVVEGETVFPAWSDVGAFYAVSGGSVLQITPFGDGNVSELQAPTLSTPHVSPDGLYWAWSARFNAPDGNGLWVGEFGQTPAQITTDAVGPPLWSPDGQGLLYLSGETLYHAAAPDFIPVAVQDGLSVNTSSLAWVSRSP